MQYYFLLLSLPPLSLKSRPEISFKELRELLELNLTPSDLKKVRFVLRLIDLYNIRSLWAGLPLDERGNFSAKELEEFLLVRDEALPDYIVDFLDRYDQTSDRLRYFSSLFTSLYSVEETAGFEGFLGKYYEFEREMRLIVSAIRAKQIGRDIVQELQFEDPLDPTVSFILAQKEAPDFTPPQEFEDLKTLIVQNSLQPQNLNRAILEYQLAKIDEMVDSISFSIDQVLKYVVQFLIVDGWFHLDREKGQIAVNELSQYE